MHYITNEKQVQYMDGLRVPLIVYDNDDYFDFDEDEIITLSGTIKHVYICNMQNSTPL